jgi:hypothetical protein
MKNRLSESGLLFCLVLSVAVLCNIQTVKAQSNLTVEGVWVVTSTNDFDTYAGDRYVIVREGNGYSITHKPQNPLPASSYIKTDLYYGTPTQIMVTVALSYDDLVHMYRGTGLSSATLMEWAGKIIKRYQFTLSGDGRSAEYANDKPRLSQNPRTGRIISYEIIPYAYKTTLARISGPPKVENRSDRAYQADCGSVDPNRTTPFPPDHEFCPGNLVCMTNFCGGGMGCPYVCCPKGLPYLNHCDCKCYENSNFDCHSYSYCKEKLIR